MPIYQFKNKDTGEIFEKVMKISEYEEYKTNNPNIEQYFDNGVMFGDPTRMMDTKISKGDPVFQKYVLNRIASAVPGNTLKDRKFQTPREW